MLKKKNKYRRRSKKLFDGKYKQKIFANDIIIHAIFVYYSTGVKLSVWCARSESVEPGLEWTFIKGIEICTYYNAYSVSYVIISSEIYLWYFNFAAQTQRTFEIWRIIFRFRLLLKAIRKIKNARKYMFARFQLKLF